MVQLSKKEAQQLWARHKYFVLSRSQNQYRAIRAYLKSDSVDYDTVYQMIVQAYHMDENRGEMINCAMHLWGYFKRVATPQEKEQYMVLLASYQAEKVTQHNLLHFFKTMLEHYPNRYLENSSILNGKGLEDEIVA